MLITKENYHSYTVGGKAEKLFELQEQGYPVPEFFCVQGRMDEEKLQAYLREKFAQTVLFSVRSSASVEDGGKTSFAGQFDTFLNLSMEQVWDAVQQVMDFAAKPNLQAYCHKQGISLDSIQMTVVVQEMVQAECSGVLFSANPQGILNETVIVLGRGSGDNIVEDKVDVTTYYINESDGNYYLERQGASPLLSDALQEELLGYARKAQEQFGFYCDMEFAVKQDKLYLLQLRPITTLSGESEPIVLDNSNIVESYPGISLPLTQSFVKEVYYKVFRSLLLRLTKSKSTVEGMDDILRNMVDVANGRIYYRISNWYDVILLLPFHKKIIPIWQEMLGVSQKTVTFHSDHKVGAGIRLRVLWSFVTLMATTPSKMRKLEEYFGSVLEEFAAFSMETGDNRQLNLWYRELLEKVTDKWDITLANDMYAFIYTALLKKSLKKKGGDAAANTYISQISDIESMKPIRELTALSKRAVKEGEMAQLEALADNASVWEYLKDAQADSIQAQIVSYIEKYGDRNLEELKLESKTFRTDPVLLIKRILQYGKGDLVLEEDTGFHTSSHPALRGLSGYFAKRAALGIRNRETSRMNRGRLYGMMRQMMLSMGENYVKAGKLEKREDIFWLHYEEIEQELAGEQMPFMERIEARRKKYAFYEKLPAYGRLVFADKVVNKTPTAIYEKEPLPGERMYYGTPCSGGVVQGEVLIVENPTMELNTAGKILVTKMTDPGWVFLIAEALGVVAEKGSLLSHTAIISRELKKPAVVGVLGVTKGLQNGQLVQVDGNTGEVRVL